jgi:hypothetical protein
MSNQYFVNDNQAHSEPVPMIVTVADSEIKQIFKFADEWSEGTYYLQEFKSGPTREYYLKQRDHLIEAMMSWFYSNAITDSLLTGRPNIVINLIENFKEQIIAPENKGLLTHKTTHENMYKIMKNITLEWAQTADFHEFHSFILRFVQAFLRQKGQKFDTTHASAFAWNVNTRTKFLYSEQIVEHLFTDTDVNWFITSPSIQTHA